MNVAPLRVFVSYSHADRRWKERLVTSLHALPGQIDVWADDRIDAGSEWSPEIENAIAQADIAVLLISENFLKSPFILEQEVPKLLERRKLEGLKVMPLIVAGEWKGVPPWLAELQVRPRNPERPLSKRGRAGTQRELTNFVLELWRIGFGKTAPAADRRKVRVRQLWVDLPSMGYAVLPLMIFIGAVLVALSTRVETDVQLTAAAHKLSFTVGGDAPVQLLDNSTLVSQLVIEDCGVVSLPPVRLEPAKGGASYTGPVSFRCSPDIPGSQVQLRPVEPAAVRPIGTLSRVTLQPRDYVVVETYDNTPPGVRFEVWRRTDFEFTLTTAPFTIESQHAGLEGTPLPDGAYNVTTYLATIADEDGVRLVKGEGQSKLKLFFVPPSNVHAAAVFRSDLYVPLTAPSVRQRNDAGDSVASTAVNGTLTYPGHPDVQAPLIARGDELTLCQTCSFTLTSLNLGPGDGESALTFSLGGAATSVKVNGVDRRLTWLDTLLASRAVVIAAAAYVIVAVLWIYRYWPRPGEAV